MTAVPGISAWNRLALAGIEQAGMCMRCLLIGVTVAGCAWAQAAGDQSSTGNDQHTTTTTRTVKQTETKRTQSPGREVAGGTGNIAGGAAKGAGHLAEGTGKGAVDLVTLHPIDAAGSVGRGAASAGKDVGVGTVKGTARVTHGIGRAIKHIF